MDKKLKNKDLEEVNGGVDEPPCDIRDTGGTMACFLATKGKLRQCRNCSHNHD